MAHDIDVLNEEMITAGVRVFVGGLTPASSARSLRVQPNGKVLITDGPYLETKERIVVFGCWKPPMWIMPGMGAQSRHCVSGAGRGAPVITQQKT